MKVIVTTLLIVLLGTIVVWAGIGVGVYLAFESWEQRGQFGDMFGVANSLFAGLALAGVAGALLYQGVQLRDERMELELTRARIEASTLIAAYSARIAAVHAAGENALPGNVMAKTEAMLKAMRLEAELEAIIAQLPKPPTAAAPANPAG